MSSQQGYEAIELQLSDEVKGILESRGIYEEEVKMVIYEGETTDKKLYQLESSRHLAKKRIGEATFYVEYSTSGEKYIVYTAYSHRAEIER